MTSSEYVVLKHCKTLYLYLHHIEEPLHLIQIFFKLCKYDPRNSNNISLSNPNSLQQSKQAIAWSLPHSKSPSPITYSISFIISKRPPTSTLSLSERDRPTTTKKNISLSPTMAEDPGENRLKVRERERKKGIMENLTCHDRWEIFEGCVRSTCPSDVTHWPRPSSRERLDRNSSEHSNLESLWSIPRTAKMSSSMASSDWDSEAEQIGRMVRSLLFGMGLLADRKVFFLLFMFLLIYHLEFRVWIISFKSFFLI